MVNLKRSQGLLTHKMTLLLQYCNVLDSISSKMKMRSILVFTALTLFFSCTQRKSNYTAQEIVDHAIINTGVHLLKQSDLQFDFRDMHYRAKRNKGVFKLLRQFESEGNEIEDILSNSGFTRKINGKPQFVPDSIAFKFTESVNSVHYFSVLPFGLNDKAVIKNRLKDVDIKGKRYYKIEVRFKKEGGGADFNDIFVYWFEHESFKLEYLAYKFHTNGGGIRFREVSRENLIKGVRFVDYINYKPKNNSSSLLSIDEEYLKDNLLEVSTIEMKNIELQLLNTQ